MGSIADAHGFFWQTIWQHPENDDLRSVRKDPMVLLEGDRVTIPEKRLGSETGATEQKHRFRRRGIPAHLLLRFLDEDEPRAHVPCTIIIDGHRQERSTDGEGVLKVPIPPDARSGEVHAGSVNNQVVYALDLGQLSPFDTLRGVQQRLRNLGLYDDDVSGELDPETRAAILAFQQLAELEETGEIDDRLRQKLKALHGS